MGNVSVILSQSAGIKHNENNGHNGESRVLVTALPSVALLLRQIADVLENDHAAHTGAVTINQTGAYKHFSISVQLRNGNGSDGSSNGRH